MSGFVMVIPAPLTAGECDMYPGNIQPGDYTMNQVLNLLRQHLNEPGVIEFIADMLEE